MRYALNKWGQKITAQKGLSAMCDMCSSDMIPKCGQIKAHHWAHKSTADCDLWHEPETEWHLYWKSLVEPDFCEKIIEKGGERHRADIIGNFGLVIEVQHSSIGTADIEAREDFYNNMLWVFDAREAYDKRRLSLYPKKGGQYYTFRWKHPRQSIAWAQKPVFLDYKDGYVFQLRKQHENMRAGWGYVHFFTDFIWLKMGQSMKYDPRPL
jgi:hypothetical protein